MVNSCMSNHNFELSPACLDVEENLIVEISSLLQVITPFLHLWTIVQWLFRAGFKVFWHLAELFRNNVDTFSNVLIGLRSKQLYNCTYQVVEILWILVTSSKIIIVMNIKKSNDHSRYSVCSLLIRIYVAQILLNEAWPEKKCILSFWHFKTYQIGDPLCSSCSSLLVHASSPNLPSLLVFQLHLAKLEESIVYI